MSEYLTCKVPMEEWTCDAPIVNGPCRACGTGINSNAHAPYETRPGHDYDGFVCERGHEYPPKRTGAIDAL